MIVIKNVSRLRWIIRAVGLFFALFYLWMIIIPGISSTQMEPLAVPNKILLISLSLQIICFGLAWKWEKIGGLSLALCSILVGVAATLASNQVEKSLASAMAIGVMIGVIPFLAGFMFYFIGSHERKNG